MNAVALINLALAVITWKWAKVDFENGENKLGWVNIIASAVNAACFANLVL